MATIGPVSTKTQYSRAAKAIEGPWISTELPTDLPHCPDQSSLFLHARMQ